MFSLEEEFRYWLYSDPTDMRKSYYTLSGLVNNKMGTDPRNGDVYIFINKRRNRIKLLHYETGGMVIYSKMLDRGTFGMPISDTEGVVSTSLKWGDLRKMVERIMSDPDSRQARLDGLKSMWKK
ncbi:MAG: IS66 family insertion sequence element accessory protein TnpB [Candidatus Bathyarchaeota archaeon]|nr:IS66 family insertion sequence element accessory protein TnpB [Candidatus Bathyarchaeota archaeon]